MTPREYKIAYNSYMKDDEVYYFSEHRGSFSNSKELKDIIYKKPSLVIFAISITRFEALKAEKILRAQGHKIAVINILWLKPFSIKKKYFNLLKKSKFGGLVLDDDYEDGIAKSIANDLNLKTNKTVNVMGLKNKSAGFHPNVDNLPPSSDEIIGFYKKLIKKK